MSDVTTTPTRDEDDLATLLAKREHARPNRLTWILLGLLVLAVGFAGGAVAYQKFGPSTSGGLPSFGAGLPDFAAGGFPGTGTGSIGAPAEDSGGDTTVGTVKLVDGKTIYVSTGSDSVVIVTVPADVPVTKQKAIDLSELEPGSNVTVAGSVGTDGKVVATSVSAGTPPTDASGTTTSTKE